MRARYRGGFSGFTLIELLVVIAIIGLLLAVLVPALGKAKEQTREVVCRAHLRQWGVIFSLYLEDHDNRFMPGIDEDWQTGRYSWICTLMPYYDTPEIRLCPKARLTEAQGGRPPHIAWDLTLANEGELSAIKDPQYKIGSYGINWWVNDSDNDAHTDLDVRLKWRTGNQKNSMMIPVLSDAGFMLARPQASDDPPPHDGLFAYAAGARGMDRVCTNRHKGGVNILYMDWTVRKVGLKDLWRQEWHRNYVPQEHVWPEWMEKAR